MTEDEPRPDGESAGDDPPEDVPLSDLVDRTDGDRGGDDPVDLFADPERDRAPADRGDAGPESPDAPTGRTPEDGSSPFDSAHDGTPGSDAGDDTAFSRADDDAPSSEADDAASPGADDDAPLSGIAREIADRRSPRGSADSDADLFEEVDVDDVDSETVWDSLDDFDEGGADVGAGAEASRVDSEGTTSAGSDHVVPKASYCQRCEYLSDPPELACGHEGTEIVEVVDSEQFRVRECPYVDLGGTDGG
jgi:hypothetical protein